MVTEGILFAGLLLLGIVGLLAGARKPRSVPAIGAALAIAAVSSVAAWAAIRFRQPVVVESAVSNRPVVAPTDDYVSSDTCRACHPGEYDSWRDSFHPKMTQVTRRQTVLGSFDNVDLSYRGRRFRFEQRDGEFWFVELPGGSHPPAERPVVLSTGSHHLQVYWYWIEETQELATMPFVYLVEDEMWIPYDSSFVTPPRQVIYDDRGFWPRGCIRCHTTHGRPGLQPSGTFRPEVAEFGIACEACHGPGDEHIRVNRDPVRRYSRHLDQDGDETSVHPTSLPAEASSQVCGQCHGVWIPHSDADDRRFYTEGPRYRPGNEITDSRVLFQLKSLAENPWLKEVSERRPLWARGAFWPDGMARVTGREYHGLVESPCYTHGDESKGILSCFSCHRMHQSDDDSRPAREWANDQLDVGMNGDAACVQCHTKYEDPAVVQAHGHHEPGSTGNRCYNCHMPPTTYGLLKGIRSHAVTSPTVQESLETGRPNACNQCHLNETLAWSADYLDRWYDTPRPVLTDDEHTIAASVLWLLRGDAGQRALMAWSMGWEPALEASGRHWVPLYLGQLLDDPYDAVRFIAWRSLRNLPGYESLEYRFGETRQERVERSRNTVVTWQRQMFTADEFPVSDAILIGPGREVRSKEILRLGRQRDDTPITLQE